MLWTCDLKDVFVVAIQCLTYFIAQIGVGVFIAQFWGKKDLAGIRKSLGLMTLIAFVVSEFMRKKGMIADGDMKLEV